MISKQTISDLISFAEQGNSAAQFAFAMMCYKGKDALKNDELAVHWWRKAAEQGEPLSQYCLGMMYCEGESVPKDYTKAAYWCRKSAEQGFVDAQFILGAMYRLGDGIAKDEVEAYKWFNLAGAQGHKEAARHLELLEAQMLSEDVAEAQKQASEWDERENAAE